MERFCGLRIKGFSTESLLSLSGRHIAKEAKVATDEWKGYRLIAKDFQITQLTSEFELNFKALHIGVDQGNSWIKATFSWVSKRHIEPCLNGCS